MGDIRAVYLTRDGKPKKIDAEWGSVMSVVCWSGFCPQFANPELSNQKTS